LGCPGPLQTHPNLGMANPVPDDESISAKRQEAAKTWRERFPGWEAIEGRPSVLNSDAEKKDFRYDTNLNPHVVVPRRPGVLVMILGVTVGILLLLLLSFLMYRNFQRPSPRSPQNSQSGRVIGPASVRMQDAIADNALPLRKQNHVHELSDEQPTGPPSTEKRPAQLKSRRAMVR